MVFNRPYKFNVFCSVFQVVDRISMKNRAFNYALSTIKYMYIFYYIVEVGSTIIPMSPPETLQLMIGKI